MDIKKVIDDIKNQIRAEEVKNKIVSDLNLKLDKYGKDDLEKIEILENSIMNCWQGVFELKNKKTPTAIGAENKNIKVNPSICNNTQKYSSGRKMV